MDGRLTAMVLLTLFVWLLNAFFQRRSVFYPRVKVPCLLAFALGSRDCFIIWSSMAVQVAALMSLLVYIGLFLVFGVFNPALAVLVGMLLGVILKSLEPKQSGHA